ncbi:MAG: hypothetical protein AB4042_08690 [Leptolyngbyaceae cyanobacterium]
MAHSTNQAMSDPRRSHNPTSTGASSLAQWLTQHGQHLNLSIKGRVRGHSLHVLCESLDPSDERPPSQRMVRRYFQTHVDCVELNQCLGASSSRIRHLWIYGRMKGAKQPAWTVSMPLMSLPQRHPQPYQGVSPDQTGAEGEQTADAALATVPQQTDWYTLAEQGHPNAIAHYLHYILADLGVNAKVRVKVQRDRPQKSKDRLWITCRGSYCPAAALVGKPIARQLRALSLANIEDAILQFQVSGESTPDWILRIDLTPQKDMLQDWARWGDVEAISRLVNQRLQPCHSQLLEATLKDTTLHLSCATEPADTEAAAAEATAVEAADTEPAIADSPSPSIPAAITTLLTDLAPQGIHGAVIYGQHEESATPLWVEWLDLPAKHELDRAVTPLELANNGDGEAIAFLLRRLLNPDLNAQLATGGIRIQVLTKPHTIHVMCDAPLCPAKADVVPKMERLLQSLELPGIQGIRLYGRRAGQRQPRWHHIIELGTSTAMVPEPTPQFAATDAYVTELVTPTAEPMLRPDLTPSELWSRWQTWRQRLVRLLRRSLLSTHLVVPTADSPELMLRSAPRHATVKTAMVWAAVGALALVQTDLGLRQLARLPLDRPATTPTRSPLEWNEPASNNLEAVPPTEPGLSPASESDSDIASTFPVAPPIDPTADPIVNPTVGPTTADPAAADPAVTSPDIQMAAEDGPIELHHSSDDSIFDASGFTATAEPASPLSPSDPSPSAPPQTLVPPPSNSSPRLSATGVGSPTTLANSPYPSFNSDQLDYKLALYYQRLLDVGPPDVLVLGSSRALRGIDPVVLEQALTDLGYANADVFNFGVNGATAQVVELILQEILLPEQLPKLIIWADGARAFNSGRDDRTYNGIAASEGYEQLLEGSLVRPSVVATVTPSGSRSAPAPENVHDLARSLSKSYQALDERLSDVLGDISTAYDERDRLKAVLQQGLTALLPSPSGAARGRDLGNGSMAIAPPESPDNGIPNNASHPSNTVDQTIVPLAAPLIDTPASLSAIDNIDADGFLPLPVRFDPAQYYQQYARVAGNYDRDYSNFQLEGRQGDALQTLVALGQTYQIPIVFINMPLTEEYLDPFRIAYEQTFRQYMLDLALQQEYFIFRDLGQLWLPDANHRSYFSDPSHLNQYGAIEVSQHISKDPMIPWDITTR